MRLREVVAAARDDVQARSTRESCEAFEIAADVRQGLLDDRRSAGVAEQDELASREVLVVEVRVLPVSVGFGADRRMDGRREGLFEEPRFDFVARLLEEDLKRAQDVLVRERHAQRLRRHGAEHGVHRAGQGSGHLALPRFVMPGPPAASYAARSSAALAPTTGSLGGGPAGPPPGLGAGPICGAPSMLR
jgi:hypothetical protein